MTTLRRSSASKRIRDLTQQLAEEYDSIPLAQVSRVVRDVAAAASALDVKEPSGAAAIPALVAHIERLAREDLDWVQAGQLRRPRLRPESAARGLAAARHGGRRQGVASPA
jgi:hypothetical protein